MQRVGLQSADVLKIKGFDIEELVGKGSYSTVYSCRSYGGGRRRYAAKLVDCGDDNSLRWAAENEIEILKGIGRHVNVVRCHGIVRSFNQITTILDYIPGPSLLMGVIQWPYFSERDAKVVMNQVLSALEYCHSRNIVHRDVRPQNILWVAVPTVQETDITPLLKLIDFNLSRKISDKFIYAEPEGDPTYMAPECLSEPSKVSLSSDIWSVGVMLFTILAGYPPFLDYNYNYLLLNIIEGNYALPDALWDHVTAAGKDIVKKMFQQDFNERWSSKELLMHDWFTSCHENDSAVWPAQQRLASFLKKLEQLKLRSNHRQFNLKLQERKAFIPDESMIS